MVVIVLLGIFSLYCIYYYYWKAKASISDSNPSALPQRSAGYERSVDVSPHLDFNDSFHSTKVQNVKNSVRVQNSDHSVVICSANLDSVNLSQRNQPLIQMKIKPILKKPELRNHSKNRSIHWNHSLKRVHISNNANRDSFGQSILLSTH